MTHHPTGPDQFALDPEHYIAALHRELARVNVERVMQAAALDQLAEQVARLAAQLAAYADPESLSDGGARRRDANAGPAAAFGYDDEPQGT